MKIPPAVRYLFLSVVVLLAVTAGFLLVTRLDEDIFIPDLLDIPVGSQTEGLVYLSPALGSSELWHWTPQDVSARNRVAEKAQPRALSATGGKVYDFAVSTVRDQIAFSARNSSGGIDLWLTDLDGKQQLLLDCGVEICNQPDWSFDASLIAYARLSQKTGYPVIWVVELASRETYPLFSGAESPGAQPDWSPVELRLAYSDIRAEQISLYNLNEGTSLSFSASIESPGSWSPDGQRFAFLSSTQTDLVPYSVLYLADLSTGEILPVSAGEGDPVFFSQPLLSPSRQRLAVGARYTSGNAGQQIWLINLDGSGKVDVTDDPVYNHSAYRWDSTGARLVYQRYRLDSSDSVPEIWIWDESAGSAEKVCSDCALPQWIQ